VQQVTVMMTVNSDVLLIDGKNAFQSEQMNDVTLEKAWSQAKIEKGNFFIKNDLLYHRDQV